MLGSNCISFFEGESQKGKMVKMLSITSMNLLWARQDSNLRPTGYEPDALTTELRALGSHFSRWLTDRKD